MSGAPPSGALVNAITDNGPAARSNLRPGDVIVKVEAEPVVAAQSVLRAIFARSVGDKITLEVVRGGQRYKAQVTLARRNEPTPPPLPMQSTPATQPGLGLQLDDVADPRPPAGAKASLARVVGVAPGSAADRAGIRPGDLVLEADGAERPDAAGVRRAAQDGRMLCRVKRGSAIFYTAIRK